MTQWNRGSALLRVLALSVSFSFATTVVAQEHRDGEVRNVDGYEVWSAEREGWVTPLEFWHAYAKQRGGLTWGTRSTYPEYAKVKEHDLLIIELDSGSCLMEFFHTRWRRANDVRRWDPQFNDVGGCPNVFK